MVRLSYSGLLRRHLHLSFPELYDLPTELFDHQDRSPIAINYHRSPWYDPHLLSLIPDPPRKTLAEEANGTREQQVPVSVRLRWTRNFFFFLFFFLKQINFFVLSFMSELNDISEEIRKVVAYLINVINNPPNRPFSPSVVPHGDRSVRCLSQLKKHTWYGKVQVVLGFLYASCCG